VRIWLIRAAAAVLTLALGIGMGAGPLQRSDSDRDKRLAAQRTELGQQQRRIKALESTVAFGDAFASVAARTLVRGALAGHPIVVVTLPGADPAVITKLRSSLALAQGKITAQVDLAPTMAKASSRQLVEALTSQMVTEAKVTVPAGAGGYERFGALLARAVGTGPTGKPAQASYDPAAVGIVSGLESADLVKVSQAVSARAGLALVVAGPEAKTDAAAADNAVPVTILQALGAQLPTVVVGSTGAAGGRGVLGAIRDSKTASAAVSTVDSIQTPMGQVAGILALAARSRGTVGQFGAVDAADGALPDATQ
jgi:hypothetical protein